MEYSIKTVAQLRLFLRAFRKESGMTQASMASHLGVTQQTYAQLETNPASASFARLFRVLAVLNVELTLRRSNKAHVDKGRINPLTAPNRMQLPTSATPRMASMRGVKPKSGVSGNAPDVTVAAERENW